MSDIKLQHWACQCSLQSKRVFRKFWLRGRSLKGNKVRIVKLTSPRLTSGRLASGVTLHALWGASRCWHQRLSPPLAGSLCLLSVGFLTLWPEVMVSTYFQDPKVLHSSVLIIFLLFDTIRRHLSSLTYCRSCSMFVVPGPGGWILVGVWLFRWALRPGRSCYQPPSVKPGQHMLYIYIIYIIYSILILTGLDLLAACLIEYIGFMGRAFCPCLNFPVFNLFFCFFT